MKYEKKLYKAILKNDYDMVEKLIKKDVDVNFEYDDNDTPLLRACEMGNIKIVRLLLESGAKIDYANKDGLTPIELAIMVKNKEMIGFLLENKCNIIIQRDGFTLMHYVATWGYVGIGKFLYTKGLLIDQQDGDGRTPLHWAIQEGKYRFTKWLIESGANIETICNCDSTPLKTAIGEGNLKIVRLLIEHNVDVNRNNLNESALHLAFAWNRIKIIDALVQAGAKLDIKDEDGIYPIASAIYYNHKKLIKLYKEKYSEPFEILKKQADFLKQQDEEVLEDEEVIDDIEEDESDIEEPRDAFYFSSAQSKTNKKN